MAGKRRRRSGARRRSVAVAAPQEEEKTIPAAGQASHATPDVEQVQDDNCTGDPITHKRWGLDSPGEEIMKGILRNGRGFYTPEDGDEVEVHFIGTLHDGTKFASTHDGGIPFKYYLGEDNVIEGLNQAIRSMKRGEHAKFIIPPRFAYAESGCAPTIPPNAMLQFEIELLSWATFEDISGDEGIIKKTTEEEKYCLSTPGDLDDVSVKYTARLEDGTIISKSKEVQFTVRDGFFCPALAKAVVTMKKGEKVMLIVQPQYAFGVEGRPATRDEGAVPPNVALHVDLELVSCNRVLLLGADKTILKKTLREGKGEELPGDYTIVQVRMTGRLQDDTVFEKKGHNRKKPFEFKTNDGAQVVDGLDEAVKLMVEGDVALVTIPPEYAFGSVESMQELAVVPPLSSVTYEIELIAIGPREEHYLDMDTTERIEAAGKKKEEGHALFLSEEYKRASKRYDKAVQILSLSLPRHYKRTEEEIAAEWAELLRSLENEERETKNQDQQLEQGAAKEGGEFLVGEEMEHTGKEHIECPAQQETECVEGKETDCSAEDETQYSAEDERQYSEGEDRDPGKNAKYEKFKMLIVSCGLNNATCQLKLGNYKRAAHICTEVLIVDSKNVEAQRIRSIAYTKLDDCGLTELDIAMTLKDLKLESASEHDLARRLVLFLQCWSDRVYGRTQLMGADMEPVREKKKYKPTRECGGNNIFIPGVMKQPTEQKQISDATTKTVQTVEGSNLKFLS